MILKIKQYFCNHKKHPIKKEDYVIKIDGEKSYLTCVIEGEFSPSFLLGMHDWRGSVYESCSNCEKLLKTTVYFKNLNTF